MDDSFEGQHSLEKFSLLSLSFLSFLDLLLKSEEPIEELVQEVLMPFRWLISRAKEPEVTKE